MRKFSLIIQITSARSICVVLTLFSLTHRAIKLGDKEVEYNATFRLILHTKLANPHYKPEMQAQTTLINFTVTRDGLEDQLLAEVVRAERPDLEELKAQLTKQQNDFKIMLKDLEDDLLSRLSSAGENILGDTALVENLETTKRTATEIEEKVRNTNEILSLCVYKFIGFLFFIM